MRRRYNNFIAIISAVLALTLVFVFTNPLSLWIAARGVPPNLAFLAAMTLLIGLGIAPAGLLMFPETRKRRRRRR